MACLIYDKVHCVVKSLFNSCISYRCTAQSTHMFILAGERNSKVMWSREDLTSHQLQLAIWCHLMWSDVVIMEEKTVVISLTVCSLLTAASRYLLSSRDGPGHRDLGAGDFIRWVCDATADCIYSWLLARQYAWINWSWIWWHPGLWTWDMTLPLKGKGSFNSSTMD